MGNLLYADIILDLWRNPANFGEIKKPDLSAYELNPLCGDEIKIQLKLTTNHKLRFTKISQAKFSGNGCAISQASASLLTEFIKGKKLADMAKLTEKDLIELLGIEVGPARIKCVILPLIVLKRAISSNEKKTQG